MPVAVARFAFRSGRPWTIMLLFMLVVTGKIMKVSTFTKHSMFLSASCIRTNSIIINHYHHHQQQQRHQRHHRPIKTKSGSITSNAIFMLLHSVNDVDDVNSKSDEVKRLSDIIEKDTIKFTTTTATNEISTTLSTDSLLEQQPLSSSVMTGTVNERLLLELENAANKEKYGARSSLSKKPRKFGLDQFLSNRKTDDERRLAIEDAKDLNGINPVMGLVASLIAFGCTLLLWYGTNTLAEYYTLHPVETSVSEVYFVQRLSSVFRNVIIGLISLAAGFFGVTGVGIFLLSVRVAYGIMKGELDPTPTQSTTLSHKQQQQVISNSWDLMLNKKPNRKK